MDINRRSVASDAIQPLHIGRFHNHVLWRPCKGMEHHVERIPWIEIETYVRTGRTIHIKEWLLCSGESVPLLRNPHFSKVNYVGSFPICIVNDPIVVALRLAAMLEQKVWRWTRRDLHVLGHVRIKRSDQGIHRVVNVESTLSFCLHMFAARNPRACSAGTKDRSDAFLDHGIVITDFLRCRR